MRHLKKKNKINLIYSHKKMVLRNLSNSLIKYEFIKTTLIRSKFLKFYIEPLINISKERYIFNIRYVFNKLRNIDSVLKLFKIIAPRYINRNGGYLKILKLGFRKGDNSKLSLIKFI